MCKTLSFVFIFFRIAPTVPPFLMQQLRDGVIEIIAHASSYARTLYVYEGNLFLATSNVIEWLLNDQFDLVPCSIALVHSKTRVGRVILLRR
jgi:hypothetical protein